MIKFDFSSHILEFKTPAKTSRNVYKDRKIWIISAYDTLNPQVKGLGEAGPLFGLSPDDKPEFENELIQCLHYLNEQNPIQEYDFQNLPALKFALESAYLDLQMGGQKILFDNFFSKKQRSIPINGLVWMDELEPMINAAFEKVEQGFSVIKFKIGAHDFDAECRMLEQIRKRYNAFKLEIRLDANGAFEAADVKSQLKDLSRFEVHSIEQPIKAGQLELMQEICNKPSIDIALDEELIGIPVSEAPILLKTIKPQYIILKPSLIGGLENSRAWINAAENNHIAWWMTSALESSIGLNIIAQFTAEFPYNTLCHGLGTGNLYTNNFPSLLNLKVDQLWFEGENLNS